MGNESGEWIMHGLEWDNPACIHTVEKAIDLSTGGVMMNYMTRGCGVRL